MVNRIVHFSDLHLRLFKDHDLYRKILSEAFQEWRVLKPDRIVFTGDMVHSKNQMTPELIDIVVWVLEECASIAKTILILGNHDFLETNMDRLDVMTPIINSLNNPNIVFYKDRGVYKDDNINWCVYSLVQHNIPPDIPQDGNTNIGLFHGPISGLKTYLGFSFGDESYDINKFNGLEIVLCGDIHLRQELNVESVIEVDEDKVNDYINRGWEIV